MKMRYILSVIIVILLLFSFLACNAFFKKALGSEKMALDGLALSIPFSENYWKYDDHHIAEAKVIRIENGEIDTILWQPAFYTTYAFVGLKDHRVKVFYVYSQALKIININGNKGSVSHFYQYNYFDQDEDVVTGIAAKLDEDSRKLLRIMAKALYDRRDTISVGMLIRDVEWIDYCDKIRSRN